MQQPEFVVPLTQKVVIHLWVDVSDLLYKWNRS